jgi:hypothetical protein
VTLDLTCPSCGYLIATTDKCGKVVGNRVVGVMEIQQIAPNPGEFAVCTRCGRVSVFDKRQNAVRPEEWVIYLRGPTREELRGAMSVPAIAAVVVSIRFSLALDAMQS